MNRIGYYDYIDEKLHVLARRIVTGGKLNILSLHMHSENFYLYLFNLLYGYELENLNQSLQNLLVNKREKWCLILITVFPA